jgi:hypothetical protein
MKHLSAICSLLVFLGCAAQGAEDPSSSWEQEIRAMEKLHLKAFRDKDMTALDALFSDDFLVNSLGAQSSQSSS